MSYVLYAFDGLAIPTYLQDGDSQNIGTGNALTNFTQLAGGGFFDNYGDLTSPQAIQPITKSGVIWGDDAGDTKDILDAWRAKIGKRGRLSVLYDDGAIRWQWARLQSVNTPRRQDHKSHYLPIELSWVTADQNWRGIVSSEEEWVWGDLSWVFGDGFAEFGEEDHLYPITTTNMDTVINNGGNINSTDLRISIIPDVDITAFAVSNQTISTNQIMVIGTTFSAGEEIVIDCGAMSVTVNGSDAYQYFLKFTSGPDWLPLLPGDNTIRASYNIASGTLNTNVGYSWTEYWA